VYGLVRVSNYERGGERQEISEEAKDEREGRKEQRGEEERVVVATRGTKR